MGGAVQRAWGRHRLVRATSGQRAASVAGLSDQRAGRWARGVGARSMGRSCWFRGTLEAW